MLCALLSFVNFTNPILASILHVLSFLSIQNELNFPTLTTNQDKKMIFARSLAVVAFALVPLASAVELRGGARIADLIDEVEAKFGDFFDKNTTSPTKSPVDAPTDAPSKPCKEVFGKCV
jgi:hypothetical protein